MRRNETALVYAVTGLLLVILLVAVVFGEQDANASQTKQARQVEELPGVEAALFQDPKGGAETDPGAGPGTERPDVQPGQQPAPGAPGAEVTDPPPEEGPRLPRDAIGSVSLTSTPPATVDLPVRILENTFGASERRGDYRVVQAWRGARLEDVVARWCGDAAHLPVVETLNELLVDQALSRGQEVVVPWIDAETLLAAEAVRKERRAKAEYAKGELYSLKRGDSLWKLAAARVSKNMIPAWLERFKQLNPGINDPSVLVEGQKVRLPRSR